MKRFFLSIVFSFFCLFLCLGNASAMRCGNNLVDVGDTKIEVLAKCGEPTLKEDVGDDFETESDEIGRRKTRRFVEEWTYNFGPTRLIHILTFKDGKIVRIRTGDKGF
jgi:hypothetical protein